MKQNICIGYWKAAPHSKAKLTIIMSNKHECVWYLSFWKIELSGELRALAADHILTSLELELQPVELLRRERGPRALRPVEIQAFWQNNLPNSALGVCSAHTCITWFTIRFEISQFSYIIVSGRKPWLIYCNVFKNTDEDKSVHMYFRSFLHHRKKREFVHIVR